MIRLLLVEDNQALRSAMKSGLEDTGAVSVEAETAAGEDAVSLATSDSPDAILMDVQLAGEMNGVEAAVAIRREVPRLPVVFYSIQDDERFYRDFLASGILTHYAYVRKSNYLLPHMVVPLLRDAIAAYDGCDWNADALKATLEGVMARYDLKLGRAQAPVRVAVTGRTVGPPLFETLEVMGRDESLRRMRAALAQLGG